MEEYEWNFPMAIWQVARGELDTERTRSARMWLDNSSEPVNALTDALLYARHELAAEQGKVTRRAAVVLHGTTTAEQVARYLYPNYRLAGIVDAERTWGMEASVAIIEGTDDHGFTLDAILMRLRTGLITGHELEPYTEDGQS